MGRQRLTITSDRYDATRLNSIGPEHLENLRRWKNANRQSFFHQELISKEQQREWYDKFCSRDDDYMFVAQEKPFSDDTAIGCVGFRILDDSVDIYNIMRGETSSNGRGRIGDAVVIMCSYIRLVSTKRIGCKVLANNPALEWYSSIGFTIRDKPGDYYNVDLDLTRFEFCEVEAQEAAE